MEDDYTHIRETFPIASVHDERIYNPFEEEISNAQKKQFDYDNFSQTWIQIRNRLHENSGLQNPKNPVGVLFDLTISAMLEKFDEFIDEHILQAFVLTSEEFHLDRIADEYGLVRLDDESDDELRRRILNAIVFTLSIIYIERQGIRNYSKQLLTDNSRIYITSCNPHTHNIYDSYAETDIAKNFFLNQLVYEYTCLLHWKGW